MPVSVVTPSPRLRGSGQEKGAGLPRFQVMIPNPLWLTTELSSLCLGKLYLKVLRLEIPSRERRCVYWCLDRIGLQSS